MIARLPRLRWHHLLWLIAPLLLWWIFRQIPLRDVQVVLNQLSFAQIVVLLLINVGVLLTFSGRWWSIVRAQGYNIGYMKMSAYRLAASGISYFTPGPHFGGEPLQIFALRKRHSIDTSTAIASVTVDKLVELLVNFTFLIAGMILIFRHRVFPSLGIQGILLPMGLLALPVGLLIILWIGHRPLSPAFTIIPKPMRNNQFVQRVYATLTESETRAIEFCRERPMGLLYAILFSLISWSAMLIEYWLALHFLGVSLAAAELIMALAAARIAILLPSPGGLGTLEASQVIILGALGYDPAVGLALSLIIRARDVLFMAFGLWLSGFVAQQPESLA